MTAASSSAMTSQLELDSVLTCYVTRGQRRQGEGNGVVAHGRVEYIALGVRTLQSRSFSTLGNSCDGIVDSFVMVSGLWRET